MQDLVMIPALGCDGHLYEPIAPHLSNIVRLRTMIAGRDTFEGCVAQILGQAPAAFIVLGTSFGGRVALELALAAPERVKGLVVIGSGPGPTPDLATGLHRSARMRGGEFDQVVAEMGEIVSHLEGRNGPATRDAFVRMSRGQGAELMARQSDALAHRGDLGPRLPSIACPALMLWGVHDQFVAARDGLAMSLAIPGARYVEIAECGHFPSLEAPDETAAAIRHWLIEAKLT